MGFPARLRARMKHEISTADVEAMLRGCGQLEDLRQRIEQQREAGEIVHPGKPWETHAQMGNALAFFWVAQGFASIARILKEVDEESDPGTRGYMPGVSHDQALALLRQVAHYQALANAALEDPTYDGGHELPIPLKPRVEAEGRCPVSHLKGMLRGSQYLDNYAHVEVETYCGAVTRGTAPEEIKGTARRLHAELAKAQSQLQMAEQAVSPILKGEPVDDWTHEEVEDYLWSSLETYIWLGQIVAIPELLAEPSRKRRSSPPSSRSRTVSHTQLWCLTSGLARRHLREEGNLGWAKDELEEFWRQKQWKLSTREQQYLAEVADLERRGAVVAESYRAECPFNPIWTAKRPVIVLGQLVNQGGEFSYTHQAGAEELCTSFLQADAFE